MTEDTTLKDDIILWQALTIEQQERTIQMLRQALDMYVALLTEGQALDEAHSSNVAEFRQDGH